jgi:NAD-dependent deacetylase
MRRTTEAVRPRFGARPRPTERTAAWCQAVSGAQPPESSPDRIPPALLDDVRARLAAARSVAVLTGAGMSADSGVPTFRGPAGLWRTHRAEELATPEAFARNPRLVWEWYDWRRGLIAAARPNPGHDALAALERRREHVTLITQNVDGLHAEAGSRRLLELHGNIWQLRCTVCGDVSTDRRVPLPLTPHLPSCVRCGGLLRPHIVWFGESLDPAVMQAAVDAAMSCELFLVVGTSGVVHPAASLSSMAREAGAWVVEVNPDRSASPAVHCWLAGRAAEIVPRLIPADVQL